MWLYQKNYSKFDLEAPDWVKACENNSAWYSEGVIVWDETQKILVNLYMWAAMDLLDRLRNNTDWKTKGKDVAQEFIKLTVPFGRQKRKKASDVREPEQPSGHSEDVVIRLHLSSERTEKLLKFLEGCEQLIRPIGEIQKIRYNEGMKILIELLFSSRTTEIEKHDHY